MEKKVMKLITLAFVISLAILIFTPAIAQKDTAEFVVVHRPIWFYPNKDSRSGRVTIPSNTKISIIKLTGETLYPAAYNRQRGYVSAYEMSEGFQSQNFKIDSATTIHNNIVPDLHLNLINDAGRDIRNGTTMQMIGYGLSIAGGVTALAMSRRSEKKYQDLAIPISIGSGVLGLIIHLSGTGQVGRGGGKLMDYKPEIIQR